MDFEQLAKIENESERVNRTYDIFNEDARLNHSKAARVEFLTTVKYIEKYLKDGDKILDIGAGAGEYSLYFARKGYEISALELADANIAAFGEMWKGGGRGFDSIVMVTLGTGVGGGVILGGKILTGAKGAAGEIGHMTVEYDEEETCNCGTKGCLEQYASATGIVRLAKKQMVETSSLAKIDNLTAKDVFDEAKAGDAYALQIVDRFARYLGVALGNVAQIIDPEAFVIGGGVARAGSIITESIEKYYNDSVMFALRGKQFNLAELGNDAGIYGAVRMVL